MCRAIKHPATSHMPRAVRSQYVPTQLSICARTVSRPVSQHPEDASSKFEPRSAAHLGIDLLGARLEGGAGAALRRCSALGVGHDAVIGAAHAGARARALRAGARGRARLRGCSGRGDCAARARARAGGGGHVRAALPASQGLAAPIGARQARRGRAVAPAAGRWGEWQTCVW